MTARRLLMTKDVTEELDTRYHALLRQQEMLREEIKRGNECLRQAERDLNEQRSRLENWTTYEQHCGADCLSHLTEKVLATERVARFLNGWIERRNIEMTKAQRTLDELTGQQDSGMSPDARSVSRRGSIPVLHPITARAA